MTGGDVIDIVLVVVLVGYAVSGYRQGLIASVFSLVGFLAGALIAIWRLPSLLARWDAVADDNRWRVVALIVGVVAVGWLGQFLGSLIGGSISRKVGQTALRSVDAVLGAVIVAVAAALVLGFIGGTLRTAGNPSLARAVSESRVLRAVDQVAPEQTGQIFAGFRNFLSDQGFPQVFDGLAPEPITPVQDPDPGVARSVAIRAARPSIVKVTTVSDSCQRGQEGTGWVVSPGRIITNAHVVAGASRLRVESGNEMRPATVVLFDPERDLAVLSVEGLDAPALRLGGALESGQSAVVPGYPLDGPYTVVSARVRTILNARGYDIYSTGQVVREIYSLNTTVQPGNSGGPLLDTRGRVVGVIFAKSLEDVRTGYALTLAEAMPVIDRAASAGSAVNTGACLAA
ncbi:MAG: MarP family serine protease [Humibacillus sp.]|nr:MarP family serine protease [Humibacillus sp.]MDN5779004.1 MarP family serine protease [Humibacillus sp.]